MKRFTEGRACTKYLEQIESIRREKKRKVERRFGLKVVVENDQFRPLLFFFFLLGILEKAARHKPTKSGGRVETDP